MRVHEEAHGGWKHTDSESLGRGMPGRFWPLADMVGARAGRQRPCGAHVLQAGTCFGDAEERMSDPTHQAALMTSVVAALEAWPVQAPFGCRQRTCQAAASASDVQSSGGRGRVDHRARSEKTVESAPEKVNPLAS